MNKLIPEESGTAAATATSKRPKARKKAHVAPRRADGASAKAKSARKAMLVKKTPKGRAKPEGAKPEVAKPKLARDGSKTAKILDLLKRPEGATLKELMKATGWLPHGARLPVRHDTQENGADRHLRQGRGRRAHLLGRGLRPRQSPQRL